MRRTLVAAALVAGTIIGGSAGPAGAYVGYLDNNHDGVYRAVVMYPDCQFEDGSGEPRQRECAWDAEFQGNGEGDNGIWKGFDEDRHFVVRTHKKVHRFVTNWYKVHARCCGN